MNVPLPDGFDVWPIVDDLRTVPGVVAVTLGGSWASGRQRADSDVDLGLYYRADAPLDVDAVLLRGDDSPADLWRRIDDAKALHAELMALAGDLYSDRTWTRS